jgi:hypothetical protein
MKSIPTAAGLVLVALALAVSFALDFSHTKQDGAVDFRNRITGARLLAHGIDPYHYLWRTGDLAEFLDLRNNPRLPVSKTTVTPAFLVFYLPLAALPYRTAQFTWLFAQWILLLGTLGLWLRTGATPRQCWLMALFVTGLTFTPMWRWEAERGQCYVLLAFLFACWLTASRDVKREGGFLAGLIAGLLVALRPPFIMLLPFLALHRRQQWIGAAAGLLLGFGLPLLLHPTIWNDYFSAMQTNSDFYRHASTPPRPAQDFPATIEGNSTEILGRMATYPFVDDSVYAIARRLGFAPLSAAPFIGIFGLVFAAWLWTSRRQDAIRLLPGLAAWLFLADFFLPTIRWGYYDVLILNVFLAGVIATDKIPWAAWSCLLALPLAWALDAFAHPPLLLLYLPPFFLVLGSILFLFPSAPDNLQKC